MREKKRRKTARKRAGFKEKQKKRRIRAAGGNWAVLAGTAVTHYESARRGLIDRRIGGLGALEDLVGGRGGARIVIGVVDAVAGEPSGELRRGVHRRQPILRREVDDERRMRQGEGLQPDDERVRVLSGGLERRPQIFDAAHVEQLSLETERVRRRLHLFPLTRDRRIAHVEERCDPSGFGNELSEYLDTLRIYLRHGRAQARDVPARPGEAGDDALDRKSVV